MTKDYSTTVVIIPPKNLWVAIQDIRKKYDRNFQRRMPHITLMCPFRPKSEFKSLERSFLTLCKGIQPIEILFRNRYLCLPKD